MDRIGFDRAQRSSRDAWGSFCVALLVACGAPSAEAPSRREGDAGGDGVVIPDGHDGDGADLPARDGAMPRPDELDGGLGEGSLPIVTKLDDALEEATGPSGCADSICGGDRTELPLVAGELRSSPTLVMPEPPRIERILRQAELADPSCLDDCHEDAAEDAACSSDCRGKVLGPVLPAYRTSTDGRIALTGGAGEAEVSASRLDGVNDAALLRRSLDLNTRAFSTGLALDLSEAPVPSGMPRRTASAGRFFCADDQAPRRCGEADCYDLTLVEQWDGEGARCPNGFAQCARFASVPITVRVQNPKTAEAKVVEARATGGWTTSSVFPASTAEPIVTADGRLMVFRILGGYPLENGIGMDYTFFKDDGSTMSGRHSLSYVYSEAPCDVRAWFGTNSTGVYTGMRPWSSAHYDRRLSRYGFAAYPLRDPSGRVFAEGELVRGSYPWMDRHGNNVFFSTTLPVGIDDTGERATRFPMTIEHPKLGRPTSRSPRGFVMAGSWTHGKIVMLDGPLNNEDYGIDVGDTRKLELYRTPSGKPVSVRIDGNSNTRAFTTPNTRGNSQHMESLENTHAMHPGMRAVSPRDVVWTLTRGDVMQEVVFDDAIDTHVLLLAPMNAVVDMPRTLEDSERAQGTRRGFYRDGFDKRGGRYVHDAAKIALQNAATSPHYPIPAQGSVRGDVRLEPVAQGGIEGRGLWLESESAAEFAFPADRPLPARSFYVSVFLDVREALTGGKHALSVNGEQGAAHLVMHPGGISVHRVRASGNEVASFPVSTDHPYRRDGFHHVGALFETDGAVTVFVDGDPLARTEMRTKLGLGSGTRVTLGGAALGFPGVRGWSDDLRFVIAGQDDQLTGPASLELVCNYARGTMASLDARSPHHALAERTSYVRARAEALGLRTSEDRIGCITDHEADLAVKIPLPTGERSLRMDILEGLAGDASLHTGVPRPDTRHNGFCLTCHAESDLDPDRPAGLSLAALAPSELPVERDPRVQPGQPYARRGQPARVEGVVPASWIESLYGVSVPAERQLLDAPRTVLDWCLAEAPATR